MNSLRIALLGAVLGASLGSLSAQQLTDIKVEVDKPDFENLRSPDFAANTKVKKWDQKDWLEVEVKFELKAALPKIPKDKTLPKLTVKWFVVAQDPTAQRRKYIRLEKEVTHVNIPFNEEIYTSVYISPSGVRRLSGGKDRADKGIFWGIGGEIYFNGQLKAVFTSNDKKTKDGRPFWYDSALSASKSVQLHDKSETPFKFMWWDRYAEVENKENGGGAAAPPVGG